MLKQHRLADLIVKFDMTRSHYCFVNGYQSLKSNCHKFSDHWMFSVNYTKTDHITLHTLLGALVISI